jgi:hypothetical protein
MSDSARAWVDLVASLAGAVAIVWAQNAPPVTRRRVAWTVLVAVAAIHVALRQWAALFWFALGALFILPLVWRRM